ncbi:MAG TPA: bifunctional alpha/beta hydrolase/OsmC family protein, partial [Geothermobacteraceae bacterium]|nr:bifunctional alpha/beta hydrolase/OsmC family protein [Geothermobacteraceae bacterium]
MRSRKLTFPSSAGQQLAAILDLPEDEQPIATALFAHCFTCGKSLKVAVHIARALCREKIAVLRFDFAGLGESEGDFAESNFSSNVSDLLSAARYLEQEHMAPALLIGHSLGGAAVLRAAGEIPSVRAVATLAAPFDPAHLLEQLGAQRETIERLGAAEVDLAGRPFVIKQQLLADLQAQHPEAVIKGLKKALLVLHSPRDQMVGIENAAQIYRAAMHPKSFISLDRADHLLSNAADAGYAGQMIATWACRYLEVTPAPGIEQAVTDNRVTVRTSSEGFFTEMFANGHPLVADEPVADGGTNLGPTPYDYLLAALGACTSMTVQMYARRKGWPLETALVRLRHQKIHAEDCQSCETADGKIDQFERELALHGPLSEEQRQKLLEIAGKCPVHKTLHGEVEVLTTLGKLETQ